LKKLDDLKPQATGPLVEAMLAVLNHDGQITVAEAELLRVVLRDAALPAAGGARR